MAVKLHNKGFDNGKRLVAEGRAVADERGAWSVDQPTAQVENEFIRQHGFDEFGKWHLGIDDQEPANTKAHYKFPYGDFINVHRCGVLSAESRAGQYKYLDIERAAAHLHGMIDEFRERQTGAA